MIEDMIDRVRDWWEWDDFFRQQITLAVILGVISLAFVWFEVRVKATVPS